MHLYHPMMFVGLGGTGCRIGAEFERRLREELCGADGLKLRGEGFNLQKLLPFQLPSCLQFVYADLSEDELAQLRRRSVPNDNHLDVAARTAYYAHDLLPQFVSYPEVAKNLRVRAREYVKNWLPSAEHEPLVTPLRLGAGQLPTVGRAALFETLSTGVDVARHPISQAIGEIANSKSELLVLNPDHKAMMEPVDVFVAFSVAGGTGAGIFYDYLHLIDSAFRRANLQASIYPMVLMPSAFDEGKGGGQPAVLNAGRALLDLFRLIDDLNQDNRQHGEITGDRRHTGLHVSYPGDGDLPMRLGSVQTAFLFSKTAGVNRDDLHRSVVALMMSLVGLDQPKEAAASGGPQTFAAGFINGAVDRQGMAPTRIGRRSVSTSLVGSLSVPFDDLADMFAERLLARGVRELLPAPPGRAESNRDHVKAFFDGAGVGAVWERAPVQFQDPEPVRGAREILKNLSGRARRMEDAITALDQRLVRTTPDLARDFNPAEGGLKVLGEVDLFRLKRVVTGDASFTETIDRLGVEGVMETRRVPPNPPSPDWSVNPPPLGPVKNTLGGMKRATYASPAVRETIEQQNAWYRYRTNRCWHAAWAEHRSRWQGVLERFTRQLKALVDALVTHEHDSDELFLRRADELYRSRVGVTYLLPPRVELELTYERMLRRLADSFAGKKLRRHATEGEIIAAVLGPDGWRQALTASLSAGRGSEQGLRIILNILKEQVVSILRSDGGGDGALLPPMAHLLRAAARPAEMVGLSEEDVQHFAATLKGMIPATFLPEGTGKLSVLVVYPGTRDDDVERFLDQALSLPRGRDVERVQFQAVAAEAITIAFVRTGMGVTEVSELRGVLLEWANAMRRPRQDHYLPWRQRLGFDQDWLATTEAHRVEILQRLLAAVWNGQVTYSGEAESPGSVRIALGADPSAEAMRLELAPFGDSSSWGSLIRAYEEWTLTDASGIRLNFCREVMETVPTGFDKTIEDPDPLYKYLVDVLAEREIKVLTEMRERMPAGTRHRCEQVLNFWQQTLPAARRRTFMGEAPNGASLEELEATTRQRQGVVPKQSSHGASHGFSYGLETKP